MIGNPEQNLPRPLVVGRRHVRSFLIAVTMLVAFVAPVAGAEVPAQYRGQWCYAANPKQLFYRCRESNAESAPYIARNRLHLGEPDSEDDRCHVKSVVPTAEGHRLFVICDGYSASRLHKFVYLRLDPRTGRLKITEQIVRRVRLPPPPDVVPPWTSDSWKEEPEIPKE
jgi:hypothetical protein